METQLTFDRVCTGNYLCMRLPKAADDGPDADGWVEWSGTLEAGGCAGELAVFIDGAYTGTIPVKINSPDVQGTSGWIRPP